MRKSCSVRRQLCAVLILATAVAPHRPAAQGESAEESNFEAARAQAEPGARAQALEAYLQQFPSGARVASARQLLLTTYLNDFPQQTDKIHEVSAAQVKAATPGFDRWTEESRIAALLANAGDHGADLDDARTWAQDALTSLTEDSYRREMVAAQQRYKLPRVPQKQLHTQFLAYRASFLDALAAVDLRDGKPDAAAPLLAEALHLAPLSGDTFALTGELALAQQHPAVALVNLEKADAVGHLSAAWRSQEAELYAALEHGDKAALQRRVDAVYRSLYPPVFSLPPRQLAPGGHTALLELFTGSGCLPCAGPDLAIDSLLGSYGRQDLIVLAYDEHIPRPDPLTAPDGVLRAAAYGVTSTPAAFLDGEPADVLGAAREDVDNIVVGFAEAIEDDAAIPSRLQISLTADKASDGQIVAQPHLTLASPAAAPTQAPAGDGISLRTLAQAQLYVALVQDNIRYSGENGIRFHRMVVRAVRQVPAMSFLGTGGHGSPLSFDPVALDSEEGAYLRGYQDKNDRFGRFRFATTALPIQGGDLAVVAWVQDPVSRRVLQSAFAAVSTP